MAAKVEALKNDFLTCPLCLQVYTDPKLLSCQHTFCLGCLQKYLEHNTFLPDLCVCPFCMQTVQIPEHDVKKLPNNFLVNGLLQFVDAGSTGSSQSVVGGGEHQSLPSSAPGVECPLCEEKRGNEYYCNQCQMWLCPPCKRSHTKVPATREHIIQALSDLHAGSIEKLKQVEECLHTMVEESDAHQAAISRQRQVMSSQMEEATHAINSTTEQLQAVLEDKRQKLLSELIEKMVGVDDCLSTALSETEARRNQLDRLRFGIKDARGSTELGQALQLVSTLQKDIRGLTPLPAIPTQAKIQAVSFLPAPHLSLSLQFDVLGHITTLHESQGMGEMRYPPGNSTFHFDRVPDTQRCSDLGFVTSVVASGTFPEKLVFVAGNKGVYACPPRFQFGVAKFHFSELPLFHKPWGAVLASDKKVLITDAGSVPGEGFVAVCDLDGNHIRHLAKGLVLPRGIAFGNDNTVYVCDQEERCVYVMDYKSNGALKKVLKKDGEGNFLFLSPMEVAVSPCGDIIVSDAGHFVKVFSPNFNLKKTYKSSFPKSEFWGMCTDRSGKVYVADWNHGIHVLSNSTEAKFEGLLKGTEASGILEPTAITFNPDSNDLLVGSSNTQIYRSVLL